nr:thrombospondin type 3 repeat-containing protein [Myxococcota bacterium]
SPSVVFTGVGLDLPVGVDLSAFHRLPSGDTLFAIDVASDLGGVLARPFDVVRASGGSASIAFDGAAAGLPSGARIDALTAFEDELFVSFDVPVQLGTLLAHDHDLVSLQPDGTASLIFDAEAVGLERGLDLDAAAVVGPGRLLLSFDGPGFVDGTAFSDEDLLEVVDGELVGVAYDGSARFASLEAADLDAASVRAPDSDGDGVADVADNCVNVPNPDQLDANAEEDDDLSLPGIQHYGNACDADFDENGLVTSADFFATLRPCFGASVDATPSCAEADLDGDGVVSPADFFSVFRPSLGAAPGPGTEVTRE